MIRLEKVFSTPCGNAGRMGLLWVSVSQGQAGCLRRPAPLPSSWRTDFQGPSLHSSEKGVRARPPCPPVAILLVTPTSPLTSSPHPHGGQGLRNVPLGSGMLRGRAVWPLSLSTTLRLVAS